MSDEPDVDTGDVPLWRIRNVQFAAVAGVSLAAGIRAGRVAAGSRVADLASPTLARVGSPAA